MPIGDTFITCHGKKNRALLNGIKKPTPFPPVVKASKTPCDMVDRKITAKNNILLAFVKMKAKIVAQIRAKTMECVKPRCPNGCVYGILPKVTTSKSGSIAETIAKNSSTLLALALAILVSVKPTKPCPNNDAILLLLYFCKYYFFFSFLRR